MLSRTLLVLSLLVVLVVLLPTARAGFATVHSFNSVDGQNPYGNLTLSGNVLYGMTTYGGADGSGAIFSVNTDGSGYTLLYSFTGGNDGSAPQGSLTLVGNMLYGTTSGGGSGAGTIFSMTTDTHVFNSLYSFTGGAAGAYPFGSLTLSGNMLYGTTSQGGIDSDGTLFSITTDSYSFNSLHIFLGGDGAYPYGSLTISGNMLYGTTSGGGSGSAGTIFSLTTDSYSFNSLYSLNGGTDGKKPEGSLTLSGNMLYGTAFLGGAAGAGTIFSITTDTNVFNSLYGFTGGSDGGHPEGSLTLSGNVLYGTASTNGITDSNCYYLSQHPKGCGTLFSLTTNSYSFNTLYEFTGASDGGNSYGALTLVGNTLYGMASNGGVYGWGTIFSFNSLSLSLSPPTATIDTGQSVAFTNTTSEGAPPYLWSYTVDPMTGVTVTGNSIEFDTPGTYNVIEYVQDATDANVPSNNAVITVNALPEITLSATTPTAIDTGNTVTFSNEITPGTGTGPFTYAYTVIDTSGGFDALAASPAEATISGNTITFLTANDYSVTENTLDSFGNTGTSPPIEVTVNSLPTISLSPIANTIYEDQYVAFTNRTSGGTAPYQWSYTVDPMTGVSITDNSIEFNTPGTYNVIEYVQDAADANVPSNNAVITVNPYPLSAEIGPVDPAIDKGQSVSLSADQAGGISPYSYQWYSDGSCDSAISDATGESFSAAPSSTATFSVAVTDSSSPNAVACANDMVGVWPVSGLNVLHSFDTHNAIGVNPHGTLTPIGNTLYGTTESGGSYGDGTVFSVNTDGTGYTPLHNFTNGNIGSDGSSPLGALTLSGNVLYGTTESGGSYSDGTVFSVNTDGTGFNTLYSFNPSDGTDGSNPYGSLTLAGSTLYGTTYYGGTNGFGTVFSVNTDGTGFNTLYSFTNSEENPNDGANPRGSLTLSGNFLYGTTEYGGLYNQGTVFSLTTNTFSFNTLYSFNPGDGTDGSKPYGSLTISGSTLYGTTYGGGSSGGGTVFSVNTDGTGFNTLYPFGSGIDDGANPEGALNLTGSTLYGTTVYGGNGNDGTVFSVNTDGTGFNTLYAFTGITGPDPGGYIDGSDGMHPYGALILSGNTLYSTAFGGGAANEGDIFSVTTDTFGFNSVYSFNSAQTDGFQPRGSLTLSGNVLYGTTNYGDNPNCNNGPYPGCGTIFSVNTDGTNYNILYGFTGGTDGAYPLDNLTLSGNTLYGTTSQGGDVACYNNYDEAATGCGTVFSVNTDGTGFTTLYTFTDGNDGANPQGSLTLSGNTLYGTTAYGGNPDCNNGPYIGCGTVFSVNTDSTNFNTLYLFSGGADGANPMTSLILFGNTLYGTASAGGSSSDGTIFSITTDSYSFNTLYSFTGSADGQNPMGSFVLSGNTLYSTASNGGTYDDGTIFSLTTDTYSFNTLYGFTGESDGLSPVGSLTLSGNTLYGTTEGGGDYVCGEGGCGTLFSVNTDGTGFNSLYLFSDGTDGASPAGSLTLIGNTLYGTASLGGSSGGGTVFCFNDCPLSSSPSSPLTILLSPTTNAIDATQSVAFTNITSGGTAPYQWSYTVDPMTGITVTDNSIEFDTPGTYNVIEYVQDATDANVPSNAVIITVNPLPTLTSTPITNTIDLTQGVTFDGVVGAGTGTGPFTYSFTTNAASNTISVNTVTFLTTAGTYNVVEYVKDSTGANVPTSTPAVITVNPLPVITLSPLSNTIDANQIVTFSNTLSGTGSGPFVYSYLSNALSNAIVVGNTIRFPTAGTYNVVEYVQDSTGANVPSVQAIITVNSVHSTLTISLLPTTKNIDTSQSILFTNITSGGTGPYLWSYTVNSMTGVSISGNSITFGTGGTYNVIEYVLDSLGANVPSNKAVITVSPALSAYITPANPVTTGGITVTLTAVPGGGTPPYHYQWYSDGSCTSAFSGSTSNTFVTAPSATVTFSVGVTDSLSPNSVTCASDPIVVRSASGYGGSGSTGAPSTTTVPPTTSITTTTIPSPGTNSSGTNQTIIVPSGNTTSTTCTKAGTLVNFDYNSIGALFNLTETSSNCTTITATNITTAVSPNTPKLRPISVINVSVSQTNQTVHTTLSYSCDIPFARVAPYMFSNGTWTPIAAYSVNNRTCTESFVLPSDHAMAGLFESQQTNSTTTIPAAPPPQQKAAPDYLWYLLLLIILIVIALVAYRLLRKPRQSKKPPAN